MEYKWMAAAMVLALMFAGIVAVEESQANDGTAASTDEVTLYKGAETAVKKNILLNTGAYSGYTDSEKSLAWTVKGSSGSATPFSNNKATVDEVTFEITPITETPGLYTLSMEASSTATATTAATTYTLTATMTITPTGGQAVALDPVEFEIKIVIKEAQTVPTLDGMTFTVGTPGSTKISTSSTGVAIADYNWYAIGLPEGLGMAADGTVGGVITSSTSTTVSVKVTAVEKSPANGKSPMILSGMTLTITINAQKTSDVTITFSGDAKVATTSGSTIVFTGVGGASPSVTPTKAVVETGKDASFKVTPTNGFTVSTVTAVGSDGSQATLALTDSKYTPDVSGSGSYRIFVAVSDGTTTYTLTFNLEVLDDLHGAWTPAVVINGN